MNQNSFLEQNISHLPALFTLIKLGYKYLSPIETDILRIEKTSNILLDDILRRQLKIINSDYRISSSRTTYISDANIENAIKELKNIPFNEGYITSSEYVYNTIMLGKTFDQMVDGEKKSITVQYIDWKNIENNVFHITEEFNVLRNNSNDHYRPDLVLFINGIPICIIECKRPDKENSIITAINQHIRNQKEDGIRSLYVYSQILISLSGNEAKFATNGTTENFWAIWKEDLKNEDISNEFKKNLKEFKNKKINEEIINNIFSFRKKYQKENFIKLLEEDVEPQAQDEFLFNLCCPERIMDLIFNFVLFDNGEKKIARYQQYFAVKKTIKNLLQFENGKRKGGVIWHTQGSGKSLTMTMLAQAIAQEKSIKNAKIILVTDRSDLDSQITGTFRKCGIIVENATTGKRLVELLENNNDSVITTVINKFLSAVKNILKPLDSSNIFVLVDEGHRSQYKTMNIEMQKTLPNACYIAMTGTPLFKSEKNTIHKFGGLIDSYTVKEAVEDKAVVPLLYEGRLSILKLNETEIDKYFEMISENLNEYETTDLKRKFSNSEMINESEDVLLKIAFDISSHFKKNWQGTPFKGQLVCSKKITAIKFKRILDQIGIVSSEVLISPIDIPEGEDDPYDNQASPVTVQFWKSMMDKYGNAEKYEKSIINNFKNNKDPEIIIVVDKLLTGFDEPKNTVLFLYKKLKEHNLLQAIARVNRLYEGKEYGYIIDYYGVLENLDKALSMYSDFQFIDSEDLEGTLTSINKEIEKLPQKHSDLLDNFKSISNKNDPESYQRFLENEEIRIKFYSNLTEFASVMKVAYSSLDFHLNTDNNLLEKYKQDLKFFMSLRKAVSLRYSDKIDFRKFESQIQKLLDTYITSDKIEVITELVNIFDKEKFQEELDKTSSNSAKADTIASRTAKHISEKLNEDPVFYKKFSQLLKDIIEEYRNGRIDEIQYLNKVEEIMNIVLSKTDISIPEILWDKDIAKAYYGLVSEFLIDKNIDEEKLKYISIDIALKIDDIIKLSIFENEKLIINWQLRSSITGKLFLEISDFLFDTLNDDYNFEISFDEADNITTSILEVAKRRFK
ncbi:MAG TPA: HsdR family type I site-specific deoxyribonuclease [Ignavibacteria bacterium]|nr:HsdR family type I site-specific deoxyribonuclease [Ignavibacteria bacterium]